MWLLTPNQACFVKICVQRPEEATVSLVTGSRLSALRATVTARRDEKNSVAQVVAPSLHADGARRGWSALDRATYYQRYIIAAYICVIDSFEILQIVSACSGCWGSTTHHQYQLHKNRSRLKTGGCLPRINETGWHTLSDYSNCCNKLPTRTPSQLDKTTIGQLYCFFSYTVYPKPSP